MGFIFKQTISKVVLTGRIEALQQFKVRKKYAAVARYYMHNTAIRSFPYKDLG